MSMQYPGYGYQGSMGINNQLVAVPMSGAYYPDLAAVPFYRGSGQGPPTIPLNYGGAPGGASAVDISHQEAQVASANPFDFFQSPLIIAMLSFVGGMALLRYVHWRG